MPKTRRPRRLADAYTCRPPRPFFVSADCNSKDAFSSLRQLEHEVGGKTGPIPLYCQVQITGSDPVEIRQIAIQHDLMCAHKINAAFNILDGNQTRLVLAYYHR
jgi:hypothetical protein